MKTVIVALLVVLIISYGEALKCYCGGKRTCPDGNETCTGIDNVCASITYTLATSGATFFKGCHEKTFCKFLSDSPLSTGTCCTTDLCNV